jgi:predicted enzyme related to lactoylglutathione lyase
LYIFDTFTVLTAEGGEMDHIMFTVDDAEKKYNKLVKKGASVAMKLFEGKSMKMGFVKDPDGIWIGLRNKK